MKNQNKAKQTTEDVKRRSQRAAKNTRIAPRTAEQYFAMPERSQDIWNRVAHVIAKMRADGFSLRQASQEFDVDPRTVLRWGGHALRKSPTGRFSAKASDRLLRVLAYPTREGLEEIAVRDSREASQLAKYWDALQKYLQTGDASALQKFWGVQIKDASGRPRPLLTNLQELNRLASAGVLSFESLYARAS
jgi:hypothetical protein